MSKARRSCAFTPVATGFGAGTRDPEDRPNCLRLVAIEERRTTSFSLKSEEGNRPGRGTGAMHAAGAVTGDRVDVSEAARVLHVRQLPEAEAEDPARRRLLEGRISSRYYEREDVRRHLARRLFGVLLEA